MAAGGPDRDKALSAVMGQIEKQHGKGAVMRLGDDIRPPIEVIPTGSIALDVALGIGGLPRGRVVEIYGPESSGKTTVALHAVASAQKAGGIAAFIDAEHALDPEYAKKLGVDTDALLVSQPDTGEQALEIADMLIRSGALDIIVIDSVAALVPRAEIEGEMGDSHVGLQARLMSQALRKITGALNNTGTTAIFINQLREKIGVMFGCFSYDTRVVLADGSLERIGRIVQDRLPVEVRTYDPLTNAVVARRVTKWFDNGPTSHFLEVTVQRSGGAGRTSFSATSNHQVRTPGGWREAGELVPGDRVMTAETARLGGQQWQVVLGGLMGGAELAPGLRGRRGTRFRMGHGRSPVAYLDWKASLFEGIGQDRHVNARGATFVDLEPLPELGELREVVYWGDGKKHLTDDFLKSITPLALAVWFMDAAVPGAKPTGEVELGVEGLSELSRIRLGEHLRDTFGVPCRLGVRGARETAVLTLTAEGARALHDLVAPYVHPCLEHLLPTRLQGAFQVAPEVVAPRQVLVPGTVLEVRTLPQGDAATETGTKSTKSTKSLKGHRFDIEVEGTHNYFVGDAGGVMVHNSPETTTGGKALKFYASVRLDVRRIETLKDGSDAVGNRTRVKVVKNKVSPPFKQAEFDIIYGQGISREGGLIDMGVEQGFVRKAGAWYTYEGDQLGQGKENARGFLRDNPDLADELEKKIKEKLGVGPQVDKPAVDDVPVDF